MGLISTLLKLFKKKRPKEEVEEVKEVTTTPIINEVTITSITTSVFPPLDVEVWYLILTQLDIQELCRLCASCSYFYKLADVDYKWLCEKHHVFRFQHETYAHAFSEFPTRSFTYTGDSLCNQQIAYNASPSSIIIANINSNHEEVVRIQLDPGSYIVPSEICLYKNGQRLMFKTNDEVHIYDVHARLQLRSFRALHKVQLHPTQRNAYYLLDYCADSYHLFNGLTLESTRLRITSEIFCCSAANTDHEHYFVFVTEKDIVFYDDVVKSYVNVPNNRFFIMEGYSHKVLAQSKSYICGNLDLLCIYDMTSGALLVECHHEDYLERENFEYDSCFNVYDDFAVFDCIDKKLLYYDSNYNNWKAVPTRQSPIPKRVYERIFHRRILEDFGWTCGLDIIVFYERFTLGLSSYNFTMEIEERCKQGKCVTIRPK